MPPRDQTSPDQPAPTGEPARRILISAAEPSGDLHGAALLRAIRELLPSAEFVGLGGPRMQDAGLRAVGDLTAQASMILGTLKLVGRGWRLLRTLDRLMRTEPFDLTILIDSPMLHLPLAKRARRRGLDVLYYIAPQTWAWAEYRNKKIRRRITRAAVILPFEQEYFRSKGIRADYVGNPLFDTLESRVPDQGLVQRLREGGGPVLTMLPGSRRHVVDEVLPGQLAVCREVARRFKDARFLLSVAGDPVREAIETHLSGDEPPVETYQDRNMELIQAADLVLVASGTSTLEVAYYRKPMIVMYNHGRWIYELFGRWLISTKLLSLPNIIAGREIVPEFMPYYRTTAPIAQKAVEMLSAPQILARVSEQLDELMTPLIKTGASANTARIVAEMLGAADRP